MITKKEHQAKESAFSLIELLTAMSILSVLLLLMTTLLDQVQKSWRFGENRISQFREARVAFDLMTKNMSQATMNTYWDYQYDEDTGEVEKYVKRTELHFFSTESRDIEGQLGLQGQTSGHAVFFQAPLGYSVKYRNLSNLFNGRGYLVIHGSDREFRPSFVQTERYRYRLMEFRPPAEANQVFKDAIDELDGSKNAQQDFSDWWKQGLSIGFGDFQDHLNPLAENIILLLVTPMDSIKSSGANRYDTSSEIAPNYLFNSNEPVNEEFGQQVPPLVKVTMVAIDESTAVALAVKYEDEKPDLIPATLFKQADDYNDDIDELINHFNTLNQSDSEGIVYNYRIFSTVVMLRASKWIKQLPETN